MANSRVEKFQEYRKSLQDDNSKSEQQKEKQLLNKETGIIPMDFVIQEDKVEEKKTFKDWIETNWPIIKVTAIVIGLCAVIVAIILLAIYIGRA